jgi:hypothetical protein
MARDRPTEMRRAVDGVLRITDVLATTAPQAERALRSIPIADIRPPMILLFDGAHAATFAALLKDWSERAADQAVKTAIATVTTKGAR